MEKITFVILGATGDLTKRKLLPAIYKLVEKNKLKDFAIIGAARKKMAAKSILKEARKFVESPKTKIWKKIEQRFGYEQVDFYKEEDYKKLGGNCIALEKKYSLPGKRIFYLATLPDHFGVIVKNLKKIHLCTKKNNWPRLAFEKPFGHDLKSARKINSQIGKLFSESQIYRVDHYLGKELVENIDLTRFTNRVLEPLWCRDHVDSIQIIINENIGVGDRGGYYDKYGAMKDMVQNHMLQMVALVAMAEPKKLEGEYVRNEKVSILKKIKFKDVFLGQYEGYLNEKNVKKNSKTDTFVAAHLEVNDSRWKGVPFYLKTGKYLSKTESGIYIKFKKVECLLSRACPSDTNYFIIKLKPEEKLALEINTKMPGELAVTPITLNFNEKSEFGPNTPEAYESLIEEIIKGNQHIFVRNDAIEYSWKAIDDALRKRIKLHVYEKGSAGPKELDAWDKKHKLRWKI